MDCMIYQLNEQGWLKKDPANSKDSLSKHWIIVTKLWERQLDKLNLWQSQPAAFILAKWKLQEKRNCWVEVHFQG